ncbi:fibrillin [Nostoc minutum NIES-26]|uniref:Fibrillin n=1 Tax=Nostoc minutum NIES-26 TaxID=1844469 RepID=A0A367Q610_9NOSO|nr:fibrillin [Nostoc minutum NIES-26]
MASELVKLKQELIAISEASELGFNYTPTAKDQIEALAEKLEALNPTTEPTNNIELIQGRWRLLYSTFGLERETTLQRLSFGKLPNVVVEVTGIFQEVYLIGQQYNNIIEFRTGSDVLGILLVKGRYTIEDSKRLNIDFLSTSVKSANDDLSDDAFYETLGIENELVESTLSFSGWADITFLDENLRLVRGNQQNLYVLLRDEKVSN